MLYFDTSFLVPLILPEATSDSIVSFIRELPVSQFTISHWTRVEFSSLIARKVRMGEMQVWSAGEADNKFEEMVRGSFTVLLPNAADFTLAKQYLSRSDTGLRAGDALHLAIACNHRAQMIYTLDRKLLKAGTTFNLPMSMGLG